jgi:hypothetical protein
MRGHATQRREDGNGGARRTQRASTRQRARRQQAPAQHKHISAQMLQQSPAPEPGYSSLIPTAPRSHKVLGYDVRPGCL